jgi:ABC-type transport system involved in multi-copper enzyme maturation permease subunit
MATNVITSVNSSLLSSFRHELFKANKQLFYRVLVILPMFIALISIFFQLLDKISARFTPEYSSSFSSFNNTYGLKGQSVFDNSASVYGGLSSIFGLILIITAGTLISNEYRWNTIKMLAIRQSSRINLVLSKCLTALTLIAFVMLSFIIAWLVYGLFLKFYYSLPFSLTNEDVRIIGAGLKYFVLYGLQVFVFSLVIIAFTFLFKSVVGGGIVYLIYSNVDAVCSALGASALNSTQPVEYPGWLRVIVEILKAINPFLLNSSLNRVTQQETYEQFSYTPSGSIYRALPNPQIAISNPVWWAWIMIAIYLGLFTYLAIRIFARRDITD